VERTLVELMRVWQDHPGISLYEKLNELIKQRRSLYNGLLFAEHECERLVVSNKILEKIFKNINYPLSPYHFDEIGVEILGSIYERFLGKTIRLTQKQVRVDDKPEVRKAGGVYYTPQYIVDYIVDNTVGKLLYEDGHVTLSGAKGPPSSDSKANPSVASLPQNDKKSEPTLKLSPKQVCKLKIIDIACGSGSFLLGAFQMLIDYHIEWYTHHPEDIKEVNGVRDAYEDPQGRLVLSARKKREILVNSIYGVDIDAQAVEVTQMSLYLKVLEDENDATLNKPTMLALHEVLLPPLKNNIKCGNSLIGTDFLAQGELFDDEARRKVNAFDWEAEFPEIMKAGGFDCVIGNPPYLYSASKEHFAYFAPRYELAQYQTDYYVFFIEKALTIAKRDAVFSYIVSDSWLNSQYFSRMREHLLSAHRLEKIVVFDYPVFDAATLENSVFLIRVGGEPRSISIERFTNPDKHSVTNEIDPEEALKRGIIDPLQSAKSLRILNKIQKQAKELRMFVRINRGIHAYRTDGYGKSKFGSGPQTAKDKEKQSYHSNRKKNKTYLPELKGKDVFRYYFVVSGKYLSYGPWLAEPREKEFFFSPKVTLRKILSEKLHGTFIEEPYALDQSLYILISKSEIPIQLKFLLSILISGIGAWYLRTKHSIYDTLYPWYTVKQLESFPIRAIDFANPADRQTHDQLVALVDKMLQLHKQLQEANFDSEKEPIERQIAATDKKIDELVYKLYGLTEEEIKIVENSTKSN
jgi:hypothetical protein